jgi:hypothetical protein
MSLYPFFYFYDLEFNKNSLLEFINSLSETEWIGPHIGNYDKSIPIAPHSADNKLFTANSITSDFMRCSEIAKIASYFTEGPQPLFQMMMIKKSKNGHRAPFHPLMQNLEYDKKHNIIRTFDIIVPIQGGFEESPLEAIDTKDNSHHVLKPIGKAFMVPNDPSWHFSWAETVYDFRYTLHLRGQWPFTYNEMRNKYYKV